MSVSLDCFELLSPWLAVFDFEASVAALCFGELNRIGASRGLIWVSWVIVDSLGWDAVELVLERFRSAVDLRRVSLSVDLKFSLPFALSSFFTGVPTLDGVIGITGTAGVMLAALDLGR